MVTITATKRTGCYFIVVTLLLPILFSISAQSQDNSVPCDSIANRAFDFWLGQWKVESDDGKYLGGNAITRENNCLLLEQWQSASGNRGTSINYYDPLQQQWVQHWIDDSNIIHLSGNMEQGSMVLAGTIFGRDSGNTYPLKGTWTLLPDSRVRQFFEIQKDGYWQPWFEGFYRKSQP